MRRAKLSSNNSRTEVRPSTLGLFDFTVENSTLASRPWKYGQDYWSSFELYPEWKGSTFYIFRGIAHHQRNYWTATPVVVKTFQNKHADMKDWKLYCQTAEVTRKLASGFNKYLRTLGSRYHVDFVKPTEVVMDSISDVMSLLRYIMRFNKKFVENEVVTIKDLLEGDFTTFVSPTGEANISGSGVLDAFAHHTYQQSDRQVLVCGLQGVEEEDNNYKLTNPVLHSVSGQFGLKDRGQRGIDEFFRNHVCIKGLCEGFVRPELPYFTEPSAPLFLEGTEPKSLEASFTTPLLLHAEHHCPPFYSTTDPNLPPPYES